MNFSVVETKGAQGYNPYMKHKRVFALIMAIIMLAPLATGCVYSEYGESVALMKKGEYARAREGFLALKDYKDSAALAKECESAIAMSEALSLMEKGEYQTAREAFLALSGYQDADELADRCLYYEDYYTALAYMKAENYPVAITEFAALGDFEDAAQLHIECERAHAYQRAGARFSTRDYRTALGYYREAEDYNNAEDMADICRKRITVQTAMQRLISHYRYNSVYSLADITTLLSGVSDFERADELASFTRLLAGSSGEAGANANISSTSACAGDYYSSLLEPYIAQPLARALMASLTTADTLAGCATLAAAEPEGVAELNDRARFDAYINSNNILDEGLAALASFGTSETSGGSGKLIVYERVLDYAAGAYTGIIHMGAYRLLPRELIPNSFEEVEYVILITRGAREVGTAPGGAVALEQTCRVALVSMPELIEVARYGDFAGEPPELLSDNGGDDAGVDDGVSGRARINKPAALDDDDVLNAGYTDALAPITGEVEPREYIQGAAPDEASILSTVRAALISRTEQKDGGYGYVLTTGGANTQTRSAGAVITSYKGDMFVFPRELDGLPVVGFSKSLFDTDEAVKRTDLILPSTLEAIPSGAFRKMIKLERLKIPESVSYIGEDAFPRDVLLDVIEGSYAQYWAIAHAWTHTVARRQPPDESKALTESDAEGTVAYASASALAELVPWPQYATPLSASSDGLYMEFGNMDETRYVKYVRELIASGLFESFGGFEATNSRLVAKLYADVYTVSVDYEGMILLIRIS